MPKKSAHPYVMWRDGRPRFVPSPELRAAGHKGRDLRHEDGTWFSRGEAVDWSDAFLKSLPVGKPAPRPSAQPAAAGRASRAPAQGQPRSGGAARERNQIEKPSYYTVAQLFEDWYRSPKFQIPADPVQRRRMIAARACYAPGTVKDFRQKAGVIEKTDLELWWAPADALTTPVVYGLYERLLAERGIATARGAVAVLSIALGWGRRRGKVSFRFNDGANPARDLDMATPPPRLRVGTRVEMETLIAVADHLGRPEIGDMVALGLWTGQRQGDRLALEDRGLVKGRRIFRQAKTNAIVEVRQTPQLRARLEASAARRRAARAAALLTAPDEASREKVERRFARVILNELVDARYGKCFWRPFEGQHYTHTFAAIRAAAVRGIRADGTLGPDEPDEAAGVAWKIPPCPSLADFHDADLRDTAVTWMARGGSTIPEICAVSGHSLQSATRILRHYLAVHPEMADAAIGKMLAWYAGDDEAAL